MTEGDKRLVAAFNELLRHRGPDDAGLFYDTRCVLGHRRLAIIDLSRDGAQPFASPDGRYQLVYNGEIYNYIELRQELAGHGWRFRTKTDTEVLLAAYIQLGPACLERFNGMFAFALYDTVEGTLFMARDRLGIKPLYYVQVGPRFYFASEVKALFVIPGLAPTPDLRTLFDYLVFNRTDIHDETFTREVRRLPKGHYALCDADGPHLRRWWNPGDYLNARLDADPATTCREVEELVVSAVSLRLRSDVPVGSCLSGGLDSSILTGILFDRLGMKAGYPTFTAVYPGHPVDESRFVDALARRYPLRSHRTSPDGVTALEDFETLAWHNDEPTTGCSIEAQYATMRLARETGVVVLLDGQGGDENFAGYQYFHGFHLSGLLRQGRLVAFARELAAVLGRRQELSAFQALGYQLLPKAARHALLLRANPLVAPEFFHAHIGQSRIEREFFSARDLNESLVLHLRYKLEHLLRTEDRNSMAFSLESRVPYLDYRLVEYLLGTPADQKIAGGQTKFLQKKAVGRYTVPEILERRDKIGFGAPGTDWMRQPGWCKATEAAFHAIKVAFPGIVRPKAAMSAAADQRWKINSLAAWHRLFLMRQAVPLASSGVVA